MTEELTEEVEREMSKHWDLASCPCLLCRLGREVGCGPREQYLPR